MYNFGKIVLVPFPFTDLSFKKVRPALIISSLESSSDDVLVAFITSQEKYKHGFSIETSEIFFKETGLKTSSFIRFDKIATLDKKIILGELGEIPSEVLAKQRNIFYSVFGF